MIKINNKSNKEMAAYLTGLMVAAIGAGYLLNKSNEVTYVESMVDNQKYLVRNLPDKQQAADMLARTKNRLIQVYTNIDKSDIDKEKSAGLDRIQQKFDPTSISESSADSQYTSYSVNKGEKMVFCIRSKDNRQKLVEENVLTYVALHELAHVMTKSVGHTEEFWDNFRFLLKHAIKQGLWQSVDFKSKPVKYCGIMITDTPL